LIVASPPFELILPLLAFSSIRASTWLTGPLSFAFLTSVARSGDEAVPGDRKRVRFLLKVLFGEVSWAISAVLSTPITFLYNQDIPSIPILFIGRCLLLLVGVVLPDASEIREEGDMVSCLFAKLVLGPLPLPLRGVMASLAMSSSKLLSISPFSTSIPRLDCVGALVDACRDGPPGEWAEMLGPPERNNVEDGSRKAASKSGPPRRSRADDVEGRVDPDVDGR
jgi:hypothetical protein